MNTNQRIYGPRQYGEDFLNSISNHNSLESSDDSNSDSENSSDMNVLSLLRALENEADTKYNDQPLVPDDDQQRYRYVDSRHQVVVHQTINVPLSHRILYALFLMMVPFFITRIIVFASIKYDLLPEFDIITDLSKFIYQCLRLLAANELIKSLRFVFSLPSSSSSSVLIQSQTLFVSEANQNIEPATTALVPLATAAAIMASEPTDINISLDTMSHIFSRLVTNEPEAVILEVTSPTLSQESQLEAKAGRDARTQMVDLEINGGFKSVPNRQTATSQTHSFINLVDRISAVLVTELGYKPEWIITRAMGHIIVLFYSFGAALIISFASLFYILGVYLILKQNWQRLYLFFKGVATNEMLVTEI